jgi:TolA-binding protein
VATSTPAVSVVPAPLPLAATTATAPSSSPSPSSQPVPRAAPKAPSPLPVPPLPSTPAPPAPSTLAEELKLYERAQGALEEGRAALAVVEFRRYRSLYPRGRLRADADAGLIKALTLAGRLEEAQDEVDAARTAPP